MNENEELKIIKLSEIKSKGVEWLWYPFIPLGKITIIQGDPGDGKTTLALNIAAALSRGTGFEKESFLNGSANVIYQTAEDGLADTVKPRLEASEAVCERILVIDESSKALSMTDDRIEGALISTGAKLIILDPIQAYLGSTVDINRANEARDMTKRLGMLAEKYNCAIVLIGHMNKASGSKATYRGMGSIDFFAVARSVLLVGRVDGEPNLRAMIQIKNNLAEFGHSKAFSLNDGKFIWLGDYDISVEEVLGGFEVRGNKLEKGKELLRNLAVRRNLVPSTEIYAEATKLDISARTMEQAKKILGIEARKMDASGTGNLMQ